MNTALTDKEYVQEIHHQLTGLGGFVAMSWGCHQWMGVSMNNNPTLQFKVQGYLFHGHVRIELDRGRDVYNIHFGKYTKTTKNWKNIKTVEHVYFDQMVGIIDSHVEREAA